VRRKKTGVVRWERGFGKKASIDEGRGWGKHRSKRSLQKVGTTHSKGGSTNSDEERNGGTPYVVIRGNKKIWVTAFVRVKKSKKR